MPRLQVAPESSWQRRAVVRTGGNTTLMGCFVLAILGWQSGRKPPRFGRVGRIDKQGMAFSNMQSSDGMIYPNFLLGPIKTIVDNFKGLAEDLKLNDDEVKEMFSELRKWFLVDERAKSEN